MQRVSIAWLMGSVVVVAFGLAALAADTEIWCSATYTLALGLIGLGIAGAILGRGHSRAFWVGFAVFGGGYLVLAYDVPESVTSWIYRSPKPSVPGPMRPPLVTNVLLEHLGRLAARRTAHAIGDEVEVQWGTPASYYPAQVTGLGNGQLKIRWQNYAAGTDEWVTSNRIALAGTDHFQSTGHALLAIVLGALGGLVCRMLFGRIRTQEDKPCDESPSPA